MDFIAFIFVSSLILFLIGAIVNHVSKVESVPDEPEEENAEDTATAAS